MNITKKLIMVSILTAASLILALAAWAQPEPAPDQGPDFRPGQGPNFIHLLNLTNEQLAQVTTMNDEFERKVIEIHSEQATLGIDLRTELRKDEPDQSVINQLVTRISDNGKQIMLMKIEKLLAFRNILTVEQRVIFNQYNMGEFFFGRRHNAGTRPRGNFDGCNNRGDGPPQDARNNRGRGGNPDMNGPNNRRHNQNRRGQR